MGVVIVPQVLQGLIVTEGSMSVVPSATANDAAVSEESRTSGLAGFEGSVWINSFRTVVGAAAEEEERVAEEEGFVPGWRGAKPRGVSTRIRKWPVNGGPKAAGLVSVSIWRSREKR